MNDSFLSDFEAGIFTQRQKFQSDKLFTERFSKDFTHVRKQLDCDYSVFLIGVIMGHFNDMSEDEVPSFMVVNLLGELSQILAGFLFDLSWDNDYVEGVKVKVFDEGGDKNGFDGLLRIFMFFQVEG